MNFRIGHGYDIHRLQTGGELFLGSVKVADGISPVAHSDGDVVLHALVDALLGAIAAGDIGEKFPNTDPQWKNARSEIFVEQTMNQIRAAGYKVENADITILAERPKISSVKSQIFSSLQRLLDCRAINVKAGTNEGCDSIGRGEAIACHAVVLLTAF